MVGTDRCDGGRGRKSACQHGCGRSGRTERNGSPIVRWVSIVIIALAGLSIALAGTGVVAVGDTTSPAPPMPPDASAHEYGLTGFDTESNTIDDAAAQDGAMLAVSAVEPVKAIILLAAYSKYNDVSPLEHEVRSDIMGVVGALPGLYFAQLVARTKRPESTVRYHTKILEREGELQTETIFGNLRLFPSHVSPTAFSYLAAKREPAIARVLEAIEQADDALTIGEVAARIDRAPSTVSHHLSRLEAEDVVERTRNGESVLVSIAPELRDRDPIRRAVPAAPAM